MGYFNLENNEYERSVNFKTIGIAILSGGITLLVIQFVIFYYVTLGEMFQMLSMIIFTAIELLDLICYILSYCYAINIGKKDRQEFPIEYINIPQKASQKP